MRTARPFLFDEFGAKEQVPATPGTPSTAQVDEARADGVAEGRRLALESIAADETVQLARIAEAIENDWSSAAAANERMRQEILSVARLFIEEFCAGVLERRDVEAAENLLQRLTENSEDRRSARLIVSSKTLPRLEARLEAAINRSGVGDFVSLEGDRALAPGEARLEWRGGAISRGRAEIAAAIEALFSSMNDHEAEADDDRA